MDNIKSLLNQWGNNLPIDLKYYYHKDLNIELMEQYKNNWQNIISLINLDDKDNISIVKISQSNTYPFIIFKKSDNDTDYYLYIKYYISMNKFIFITNSNDSEKRSINNINMIQDFDIID